MRLVVITLTILISVNDQNHSSCTYAVVFFRSFHLFVFYLFLVCGFMFVNWSGKPKENFLKQPIWQNLLIRIENKPVFDKNHFSLGISKVKDFVTEQHNSLSHTDFIEKYNCQFQPLKYFGLVSALKQVKNSSITQNPTLSIPADSLLTLFLKNAKGTKVVYKKLVRKKTFTPARSQAKWNTTVADWNAAYTLAFKCTKSTTLINFQYRFLHRILPTNSFLTKIGITQDPNCSFWRSTEENLAHLLWHCPNVQKFWATLTEKLNYIDFIPRDYSMDIAVFLGLKSDTSKFFLPINFWFLLARYYIWGCRTFSFLYLLGNVTSVICGIVISGYYCC